MKTGEVPSFRRYGVIALKPIVILHSFLANLCKKFDLSKAGFLPGTERDSRLDTLETASHTRTRTERDRNRLELRGIPVVKRESLIGQLLTTISKFPRCHFLTNNWHFLQSSRKQGTSPHQERPHPLNNVQLMYDTKVVIIFEYPNAPSGKPGNDS